jgi:hypothetical protein
MGGLFIWLGMHEEVMSFVCRYEQVVSFGYMCEEVMSFGTDMQEHLLCMLVMNL